MVFPHLNIAPALVAGALRVGEWEAAILAPNRDYVSRITVRLWD